MDRPSPLRTTSTNNALLLPRRADLHIDAATAAIDAAAAVTILESPDTPPSSSRPRSAPTTTATTPLDDPPSSSASQRSQRQSASSATPAAGEAPLSVSAGKRKRSRVTPDQLAHLERIFAQDRSPTAARRKEISERLGMQERQTQIWFQNRRAKAKNQDGKVKTALGELIESPPDTPPELGVAYDLDLQSLIHEDHPFTLIQCHDLTIGHWRRLASVPSRNDLVAYYCEAKRCFTWFIQSNGLGFKMEVPWDHIARVDLAPSANGRALASFHLTRPPVFYLEDAMRSWGLCGDWTEGEQASQVLRHDLVGGLRPLVDALRHLPRSIVPELPMQNALPIQPTHPPLGIPFPGAPGTQHLPPPAVLPHTRKRSLSGPPTMHATFAPTAPYGILPTGRLPTGRPSSLQLPPYGSNQQPFYFTAAPTFQQPQQSFVPDLARSSSTTPQLYDAGQPDIRRFSGSSTASFVGSASASPPLLTQPFTPQTPVSADSALGVDLGRLDLVDPTMLPMHAHAGIHYGMETQEFRPVSSHYGRPTSSAGEGMGSSLEGALGQSSPSQ